MLTTMEDVYRETIYNNRTFTVVKDSLKWNIKYLRLHDLYPLILKKCKKQINEKNK